MPDVRLEQHDLDLTGIGSVEVATFNGLVDVVAGENAPRLEASVTGEAHLQVERIGSLLYVSGRKRGKGFQGAGVDIRLWLPAGLVLKVSTVAATIQVRGPVRALVASTYQGDITTDETGAASLKLSAKSSTVRVRGAQGRVKVALWRGGHVDVARVRGEVHVAATSSTMSVAEVDGRVQLESHHGNATVSHVHGQVRIAHGHGALTITDSEGDIQAVTGAGDVRVERVTLRSGTLNWLKTGAGEVSVSQLRSPEGLRLLVEGPVRNSAHLASALPGYQIHHERSPLRASLAGARPADLDIVAPGGVIFTN